MSVQGVGQGHGASKWESCGAAQCVARWAVARRSQRVRQRCGGLQGRVRSECAHMSMAGRSLADIFAIVTRKDVEAAAMTADVDSE